MLTKASTRLANRLFKSKQLTKPGRIYRQEPGTVNQFGEPCPGQFVRHDVRLATAPLTGQQRMILEEGLREEEGRMFYIKGSDVTAVADLKNGDAIWDDGRFYRAANVQHWGGFASVIGLLPFTGVIHGPLVDFDPADFSEDDFN